ncbi:PstS family phosphate ABC transporter substrate-binding protein [Mechercharimyces sp. CAU 1602]|uniref:PstS family phosphate ABC transporter substrate-binding protein n=1 Tax=Mechercharimyces sp. CAU 1602 TaxID=2973933 RepID=UPI002162AC65|nr:PstS family phosphate ABC transporter substrate-binding protein [Mechercharimyces sp. CAU 1602]MCS1351601.1 PstS family phosphate ABC transporter substrate-binding protein [Mechercharimyces sp. CAU 1602]
MFKRTILLVGAFALSFGMMIGCSSSEEGNKNGAELSGTVKIDGSSTVYPITQAMAEEFMMENPEVEVNVSTSGTGGGFEKWVKGEIDINNASRPIKDEETNKAKENNIEPIEIPVAFDGITVVVNKDNDFVDELTMEELKKIWEPDSKVKSWKDVRSDFPDKPIKLYGPGTSSGTFDYFTDEVVGEEGKSRTDYQQSEDDNVLITGVAGDEYSLGYFGYHYYIENKDKLKAVKIKADADAVEPTEETINDGSYKLSRPVFIYPNKQALQKKEVKAFIEYYLTDGKELIPSVGYILMPEEEYEKALELIK